MSDKTELRLGYVSLTDSAVLVAAHEFGYFKQNGLKVELHQEPSWSNIRDKVSLGALDGAQMLATMPLASSLGIGTWQDPTLTAFTMSLNGNAITVSNELYQQMQEQDAEDLHGRPVTARALRRVIDYRRQQGLPLLTFAHVFPVSTHNYLLRYWLAAAGVDPDRDVRLVVIPPYQMVANLETGEIDGYCVGEPWNTHAVQLGIGRNLVTGYEIWNNATEKVFAVKQEWYRENPATHRQLLKALLQAARSLNSAEGRLETARVMVEKGYLEAPLDIVSYSLQGQLYCCPERKPIQMPDYHVFYRYAANMPRRSHAIWYLGQMARWGHLSQAVNFKSVAETVYRTDLYRQMAAELDEPCPAVDYGNEGEQSTLWQSQGQTLGANRFIDYAMFEPDEIVAYLKALSIKHVNLPFDELKRLNRT